MTDILDQLVVLERELLLPEWEAVAEGRLSADEAAARSLMRGIDVATIEMARELFQPTSNEAIVEIVQALLKTAR